MKKQLYIALILMFAIAVSKAQNTVSWSMGMNIATSNTGNSHPRITTNRAGNPLVLWNYNGGAMFSRWSSGAFSTPVMLNMSVAGGDWMGPDIASHGDTVYVVFKRTPEASDTSHIFCIHSYNGGMTFSMPVRVDNINDSISRFPTVTTDDIGNPIIGFMKFDPAFGDARWVVISSGDFGNTFSGDVKASGWSDANSTVCDCCPGAIACSGNTIAMMYRDNNNDIRDTWAGISTDKGSSFTSGINIDEQNWNISSCPSTGPDGVIVGDTLYSTFMNAASGMSRVYFGKSSVSGTIDAVAIPLTGNIAGMTLQNYPRIATDGTALAVVWKQRVNGNDQCVLRFTNNIANGLPMPYDTVDLDNITNADVAISNGKVFVVWEDDGSGTIKYRQGDFNSVTALTENTPQNTIAVFPNPANGIVNITGEKIIDEVRIVNLLGQSVYYSKPYDKNVSLYIDKQGIYFVSIGSGKETISLKLSIIQ